MNLISPYADHEKITSGSSYTPARSGDLEPFNPLLLFGSFLLTVAFTSAGNLPSLSARLNSQFELTSSGVSPKRKPPPAESAIGELRRLSGLTWDQLARVFDVSRRSLHHWASGGTMSAKHEEKLQRTLSTIRQIDRGSAAENRTALLRATSDGIIPLDLLIAGNFEGVVTILGEPMFNPRATTPKPLRPAEAYIPAISDRMDVNQDVLHREIGGGRAAKSMRGRGSGKA